jgi:hypothetical protein
MLTSSSEIKSAGGWRRGVRRIILRWRVNRTHFLSSRWRTIKSNLKKEGYGTASCHLHVLLAKDPFRVCSQLFGRFSSQFRTTLIAKKGEKSRDPFTQLSYFWVIQTLMNVMAWSVEVGIALMVWIIRIPISPPVLSDSDHDSIALGGVMCHLLSGNCGSTT